MTLKRSSDIQAGSSYFKPEAYKEAPAILIEPKALRRDVPNTYAGVTKNRDEVDADVTVFTDRIDLETGQPTVLKGMVFTHPGLVNKVSRALNEAVVGRLGKKQFDKSPAPAWVIDDIDDATYEFVAKYYEKREAEVQAALASVPDFG